MPELLFVEHFNNSLVKLESVQNQFYTLSIIYV